MLSRSSCCLCAASIAVVAGGATAAHASILLGTSTTVGFYQRANPSSVPWTSALFALGVDDTNPANGLFSDIPHNATGIFQADASTYPIQFPIIAGLLTNGLANNLHTIHGYNSPAVTLAGWGSGPESVVISPNPPVDFIGYNLTHIRQVINTFSIGPGTLNGGNSTAVSFDIAYQFFGEPVPSPSTAGILFAGSVFVARRRRPPG